MKIAILQADAVMEQFQPLHGDYPAMIAGLLQAAAGRTGVDLEIATFVVFQDEYPDRVDAFDGYVITGSRKSVYDDEAWIHRLRDYVRLIHGQKIRLVGICFGHQLIAEALGGKTEGAAVGWGVGVHEWEVHENPWFMSPGTRTFSLLASHKDQVVKLPRNALLLAGSEFCPHSLFTIDDHILAMQGHPEFSPAYSRDLINWREDILGPETFSEGMASLDKSVSDAEVGDWIVRFLRGREDV